MPNRKMRTDLDLIDIDVGLDDKEKGHQGSIMFKSCDSSSPVTA
jgi:hypothetical protein